MDPSRKAATKGSANQLELSDVQEGQTDSVCALQFARRSFVAGGNYPCCPIASMTIRYRTMPPATTR
jgi:hypothetical protein